MNHRHGLPSRRELQQRPGPLRGTSWDLFTDPWRGAPSFADESATLAAAASIQTGEVFGLDYALDAFDPGMSKARKGPTHTIYSGHPAHRDDYLDGFYLQGSTQIDGLRHRRADDAGFYGGVPDDKISEGTADLGIQVWADSPIVTRGVLVDIAGYVESQGQAIDHAGGQPLTFELVQQSLVAQGVELRTGDIAMLHTGWGEWFLDLEEAQKHGQRDSGRATGMAQSEEFVDWAWDNGLAMVAADNFAVECLPPAPESPFTTSAPNDRGMMHQELLAKLGLPLGELWRLGPLARRMRQLQRWHAMLVVKPLNVLGGTGSPANATALL
ncbi:cyclase family protein [Paeniglutamicibacter sp. MACA_103]|uniref:cyclase family protein n=1 Tax=Paeniglutamicibacter sp. MACA_103 TaxID=3377337 RepID=UPI0038940AAD